MSELISGKEALIALANGEEVEWRHPEKDWYIAPQRNMRTQDFFSGIYQFRLKPRTITINVAESPKCYSIRLDRGKGNIEIDFKNTVDADAAYKVLKEVFRF